MSCSAKIPAENPSIPEFSVPPGWTTDRAEDFHSDWENADARGQAVAHAFGLGPGQAIMEDDYGVIQIFSSDDKFYIWDQMNDDIYEILAQDFGEIVDVLWNGGLRELKRKPLVPVGELLD